MAAAYLSPWIASPFAALRVRNDEFLWTKFPILWLAVMRMFFGYSLVRQGIVRAIELPVSLVKYRCSKNWLYLALILEYPFEDRVDVLQVIGVVERGVDLRR
jgi:hypothetical protein